MFKWAIKVGKKKPRESATVVVPNEVSLIELHRWNENKVHLGANETKTVFPNRSVTRHSLRCCESSNEAAAECLSWN